MAFSPGFAVAAAPAVAVFAAVLVPDGDDVALSDALDRLLTDPGEVEERRRRGRQHAARFTWSRAARETVAVYEAALGQPLLEGISRAGGRDRSRRR